MANSQKPSIVSASPQYKPASSHAAYDEVPYDSFPFPQSNPILLQSIARLFGLSAPDPQNARVLEIGCAAGANILSFAACYPNSKCVGFDYSLKHIETGIKRIREAGIKNLELKHISAMDVTKDFGTFDYIIAHGVLSWIPPEVQDKVIEICKTNLAPDGIAYISYNTLPGWNSIRSIRDMMIYHTSQFVSSSEKVQQARWVLNFIHESTKKANTPFALAVQREVNILSGQPDYYLLHEHLEADNYPFYFHEFMDKAKANNLQYVGDVCLETMFSANMPDETAKVLATSNDIVRTEQFMDYINDRRFRQTLLCHNDHILNWNVSPKAIQQGYLVSRFSFPEGFATHDITSKKMLSFVGAQELTMTTDDVVILAMMKVFFELKKDIITITELTAKVRQKLAEVQFNLKEDGENVLEDRLSMLALRYMFMGAISFYVHKFPCVNVVSEKPMVSELSRYLASTQEWVSNQRMECTFLTIFDKVLVRYLDGTRNVEALADSMMKSFETKELIMNGNNTPITDLVEVRKRLPSIIPERLANLKDCSLLIK